MAPVKKQYDYLVIGAGSGGMASARRAASYGANVAVVENSRLGGTCVNVGCVPKKLMWNAASLSESLAEAKGYGHTVEHKGFSWETLKEKRDAYIVRLNNIYGNNLNREKVDLIHGTARFVDNNTIEVAGELYSGKHILIATGSYPWIPPAPGAKEFGITSDGFFDLKSLPKKVAVAGAGYIGVELTGIFHYLGADVTFFIREKEFLRSFDAVIRQSIMAEYQKAGIKIVTCSSITNVENKGDNLKKSLSITVDNKTTGTQSVLEGFEEIIFAIGRKANVEKLNLEATGVTLNQGGHIVVDEYQNTAAPGILALGDVCGVAQLTPVAIAAGRKLSDRLFGGKADAKLDYSNIPSVIFSHPTCGSIGLSEEDAVEKYGKDNIKIYQSKFINMYYSMVEEHQKQHTIYKLVCEGKKEKIVGLHIVGRASDEILQGFAVAVKMGATKADFDNCVAIHPTAAEELVTMR
ncbi:hypothetical protein BDK51DRAFT_23619 [Blyttiomyces helicus]|uniref:Glutathione reductase n=1 Tax=Blyttiomyces helicus TaxID=388810 RepID=A0A4P9WAI5_9FUNG|nr:hypothetical protein BDK51DRAFT_23619 [Blyttiomyces helicus]|eukprot:RKO88523.1 hypothetical protein BDK51DRAFT_23619 [Blyttiomyces helicus]